MDLLQNFRILRRVHVGLFLNRILLPFSRLQIMGKYGDLETIPQTASKIFRDLPVEQ